MRTTEGAAATGGGAGVAQATAGRRLLVVVPIVLALLSMIGPFSIDTPFPAFEQMGEDLGAGTASLQLVVSAYLAAFAFMSLVHGPLSDAVGRRTVMLGSLAVFVVASVACAFAPNLAWLLVGRTVQGLSAGGATIVSRTVVRDLFEGDLAQRLMSRVALIFGIAPAIGPVLGGAILQVGPWPLIFGFQAALGVGLALAVLLLLPETHPRERRTPLVPRELLRSLGAVARIPAFHRLAWATGFVFGAQFLYIGGAAVFVDDVLGRGALDYWVLFVPMIGSMMVGSWLCGRAAGRIPIERLITLGLAVALVGAAVDVAIAASPLGAQLPWAVLGVSLVALGNGATYPAFQLMLLDLAPERLGSVVSLSSFLALLLNAVTSVAVVPLIGGSALGFALAAAVGVVLGAGLWGWQRALTAPAVRMSSRV
ncbi:multidrug effflux MFS transporter [Nocardioides sp.]|uniref:multidrug effflux MFS transporter n=1 Tax=Nocardioides sp. TaxID=35761 RepID=UPI0035150073